MEAYMPFLLWGGLFVLTVLVEFATQQLVSIWFAAGSLAAFLAVCFGASLPVQGILFLAVSVLLLIFTRPICRRIFSFGIKDTNRIPDVSAWMVWTGSQFPRTARSSRKTPASALRQSAEQSSP